MYNVMLYIECNTIEEQRRHLSDSVGVLADLI